MSHLFIMPLPPSDTSADLPYYQAFIHAMHELTAPYESGFMSDDAMAAALCTAIQQTAEQTGTSPAHIARLLVEYGLSAPPEAFPDSFVQYVEAYTKPRMTVLEYHEVTALRRFWNALSSGMLQAA